ncbi:hypothetical protein [Ferdinandcohnia sp. SAFN-114]|uniref:hypothetical protein n=1 Tax=Ferdinandcohnia sp. SAFN-114 TaxID=3387275 RepID=UPI003F803988
MIVVCKQHVNQGLEMIFLPHIQPIPDEMRISGSFKCLICEQKADYKLFNFENHRKSAIKKAM